MKQYGVTEGEALKELHKMVAYANKTINEEFLTTTGVSHCVLMENNEFSRMVTVTYNGYEGYTHPEGKTKE